MYNFARSGPVLSGIKGFDLVAIYLGKRDLSRAACDVSRERGFMDDMDLESSGRLSGMVTLNY